MNVDRLPSVGDVVISSKDKSYKLIELVGEGGYGSVFKATCGTDNTVLALKAEKYTKTVLKIEIGVLKVANSRKCKHICWMQDYGHVKQEFMFVVMTMLGPDLNKLRNEQFDRHFTLPTVVRVALQTLNAVEELHRCGFISRDIKPGNFAIGDRDESMQKLVFIFDFGLARKYVDKNNNHLPSRGDAGWRGTTRYGSLNAHHKQDLSRKDDLESWIYMIVELTRGSLPWRLITDRAVVQKKKEDARKEINTFLSNCPQQYENLLTMIDKLEFTTTPDYMAFYGILSEIMTVNKVRVRARYDWEREGDSISSITSSVVHSVVDISPEKSLRAGNEGCERPSHHDIPQA